MKVEVWVDNGHCCQPTGSFPYAPDWWKTQDEGLRRQLKEVGISQTLDDALEKATEFYDSLNSRRASNGTIVIGQRLD